MHIVFATTEFITEKVCDGGLANYLDRASRIISEHGHQITVVVLSEKNNIIEYQKNIKVICVARDTEEVGFILKYLKDGQLRRGLVCCCRSYQLNKKIKELNTKNKVDIVQYCHISALGIFRIKKIPSVVRMSSFGPTMQLICGTDFKPAGCKFEVGLLDKLEIMSMRRADSVFGPSKIIARVVKRATGIEVKVLESPAMAVDLDEMEEIPDSLGEKKYFLFFGTLSNIKGLKTIVDSIYQILNHNLQYYFVFVGKDCGVSMKEGVRSPAVKKIKEAAGEYSDRVIYMSVIKDRKLLNSIIYHAELCILPYRLENLPNTCIEAMELGKIVVSTFRSGVSQLIKDGYSGFLVEQNNPEALVCKIDEVLQMSDEEKKRISTNARKRIEKMKPERFYQYMMEYYQEVIDNVRGRRNESRIFENFKYYIRSNNNFSDHETI